MEINSDSGGNLGNIVIFIERSSVACSQIFCPFICSINYYSQWYLKQRFLKNPKCKQDCYCTALEICIHAETPPLLIETNVICSCVLDKIVYFVIIIIFSKLCLTPTDPIIASYQF